MPDAKFESSSFSIFGNMTSQNFPLKKGTNHPIRIFTPENGFNFKKKIVFMSRIVVLDPKLTPPTSILAIFKEKKILLFKKFLRGLS